MGGGHLEWDMFVGGGAGVLWGKQALAVTSPFSSALPHTGEGTPDVRSLLLVAHF